MTIEGWIRKHLPLEPATSAALRYERMIWQSAEALPWVHRPADPGKPFDWVEEALVAAFLAALGDARRVLDIGTGDGWPGLPLARRVPEVVALDPSPRRADLARENAERLGLANVEVVCASAEELPFPDRSFDGVVAATSIEQCTDPAVALREACRVLAPGGRLAATFEDLSAELRAPIEETAELYIEEHPVTAEAQRAQREAILELNPSSRGSVASQLVCDDLAGVASDPVSDERVPDATDSSLTPTLSRAGRGRDRDADLLASAHSAPTRRTQGELTVNLDGTVAVYRLVHRSLAPLREAEYELRFRASPALRRAAEEVRPVPTFRSTVGEPGLRPVAPGDPVLGIPLLEEARDDLLSARFFELRHRSPGEVCSLVEEAGFSGVKAYGNITWPAREFFVPAYLEGLLVKLAPHMDAITRAFGRLYSAAPVGKTSVFFLLATKP